MASPVATVVLFALIAASIAVPLAKKLPAWGALMLANGIIHIVRVVEPELVGHPTAGGFDEGWLFSLELLRAGEPMGLLRMLTSMYLHADFSHLFGNMLILGFVGYHLEERLGPRVVIVGYLLSGIVGTATASAVHWNDAMYFSLGASGAVFGALGILGAAFPMDRVLLPIPIGIVIFRRIRGWTAVVIGAAVQYAMIFLGITFNIGVWAHLGGLAGGILFGWAVAARLKRPVASDERAVQDLTGFAHTARAQELLGRVEESRDEPAVHDVWLERFLAEARCGVCGARPVQGRKGRVVCPEGHSP